MYNVYTVYNIYSVFPTGGVRGWGTPPPPPPPPLSCLATKFLFPPHQKSIKPSKKRKTSFLVVIVAPVPILF